VHNNLLQVMLYDFKLLGSQQFEILCGLLLAAEGFNSLQLSEPFSYTDKYGIDWQFQSSDGARCIAQVKLYHRDVSSLSILQSEILDLDRGRAIVGAEKAFLIVSVVLSEKILQEINYDSHIAIWDALFLSSLLDKHPDVKKVYSDLIKSNNPLEQFLRGHVAASPPQYDQSNILLQRLAELPAGKKNWRKYEDLCIDILTYGFAPPLRPPKIQSWTEDGLDRRDAIFPIGGDHPFWQNIKYSHSSRMVVVEFKNYESSVGQTEVESLQQYLLPKARRSFGLLCVRKNPSESALKARRRAWMIAENIILFLSDGDMAEIVRLRAENSDPSIVLETQMDDFFISLAP
jgi:hypothetical protein